jgi:hypothetical protein
MNRSLLGVSLVVVLASAGCASVDERAALATSVAVRLLHAVDSRDGAGACALLAPRTAAAVEETAGKPCTAAILEQDLPSAGTPVGADVYGQWAQVRLDDDTVFLAAFAAGWRVVAAGCLARDGQPYDCEIDGS